MDFKEVNLERKSIREYLDKEVSKELLLDCFEQASRAPSSKNTQPWQIDLVSGETLAKITADYLAAFDQGEKPVPDYEYSTNPMPDIWLERAREVGFSLFDFKGIGRKDFEARQAHNRLNFDFFKAPVVAFISLPKGAEKGNFLDVGLFLQNLMLTLVNQGLGSCPTFSAVSYPAILNKYLDRNESLWVTGLTIGWPAEGGVNDFKTKRAPVDEWLKVWN